MQPYFFPYIGYFQLINAVDVFVLYDDVNFKRRNWITRNNILLNDSVFRIILKVEGASTIKKINEINRIHDNRWLKTVKQAYAKAPYFDEVYPLLEELSLSKEPNLSKYLSHIIQGICAYLEINTVFKTSSEIDKDNELRGQNKILAICKALNASQYINAIGGQELYNKKYFAANNINLNFIKTNELRYSQYQNQFIPWLSIIDVMMFNSKSKIQELLNQYQLI